MDKSNRKNEPNTTRSVTAIDSTPEALEVPQFSTGDLGKVQEILFGRQMRSSIDHFDKLNEQIEQRIARLSDSCQKQFRDLHNRLDDGIESLKLDQIERDKTHQKRMDALDRQHSSLESSLVAKLKNNSDSSAQIKQQLHSQIETTNNALSKSLEATRNEFTATLKQALAELQTQKMDRQSLSLLLNEMATQLSDSAQNDSDIQATVDLDGSVDIK